MFVRKIYFLGVIFSLISIAGCGQMEEPYLILNIDSKYNNSHIKIPYVFQSEDYSQICRVIVIKENGAEGETVYNEDRWMNSEGELNFDLENGFYMLQFTVLSQRGGQFYELAFLSEEYSFSVQDIYYEQ